MSKLQDQQYDNLSLGFKDRRVYDKKDFKITGKRRSFIRKKSYRRCPTCGGLVKMPCVLCSITGD